MMRCCGSWKRRWHSHRCTCRRRLQPSALPEAFQGIPQIACFDTAFHADLPAVARVLPIAKDLRADGIQRYGFHGLSCKSIVRQLADNLPDRLIIAHLGNGASVTAVKNGKSIDTSMGLTPTGGVIMGTRSGDLDPGILVYLMREKQFDAAMLRVDRRSGLLGVSSIDSDMRRLHHAAASNADARLAIDMFCYSVRKQIAAMIAALDGVDGIVFAGGIGENDAAIRAAICGVFFGRSLPGRNADLTAKNPISTVSSRCSVKVLRPRRTSRSRRHSFGCSLACAGRPAPLVEPFLRLHPIFLRRNRGVLRRDVLSVIRSMVSTPASARRCREHAFPGLDEFRLRRRSTDDKDFLAFRDDFATSP